MKILHIFPWSFKIGGPQRFIHDLCIDSLKYADVYLMIPKSKEGSFFTSISGLNIIETENNSDAKASLLEINPDIIHHHNISGKWLLKFIEKEMPNRLIATHHIKERNVNYKSNKDVYFFYDNGLNCIKHGIDTELFKPVERETKRNVVGIIGRRTKTKIPDSFIDELLTNSRYQSFDFKIIGSPINKEDDEIEEKLSKLKNVDFIPDYTHESAVDAYNSVDIVLIPTKSDAGYTALEACSCGKPVIYRDSQGLSDAIGSVGFSFKEDSDIINILDNFKLDKYAYDTASEASRDFVIDNYSLQQMVDDYIDVYSMKVRKDIKRIKKMTKLGKKVYVFVTVHNRVECTRECIEALNKTEGENIKIFLFENHSDVDREELFKLYNYFISNKMVSSIIVNTKDSICDTVWSKSLAFRQMMSLIEVAPEDNPEYMLMIDNDKVVLDGWLEACINVIESDEAKDENINVVSAWHNNALGYNVSDSITVNDINVEIQNRLGGAFWFSRLKYWEKLGLPKLDFHDDQFFWDKVNEFSDKFGVIKPLLVRHSMKETYSSRIKFLGRNYNKDEYSMYARSMDCVASRFEFFHDIESSIIKNTELLRDDYDYYVDNVSEAGWAVSRKIASLLYSVCEFTSPMNILDLGSGFSTFVLAKYAKSLSHKINIYSYDCDDAWLKKTKSFLSKNGLLGFVSIKNYKKFKGGEFDLIFDDIEWANGVRKRDLESIVSTLSQTGILILDDIHWEVLEKKAKELDASNKCCFYDLKKYTLDGNKDRKAGLICDPDSNKLTSRFLFRNTIGKKRKTSSDIKKMKRAGVRW